eukprot:151279_1
MEEEKLLLTGHLKYNDEIQDAEEKNQFNISVDQDIKSEDFAILCKCDIDLRLYSVTDILKNGKDNLITNEYIYVTETVIKYSQEIFGEINRIKKSQQTPETMQAVLEPEAVLQKNLLKMGLKFLKCNCCQQVISERFYTCANYKIGRKYEKSNLDHVIFCHICHNILPRYKHLSNGEILNKIVKEEFLPYFGGIGDKDVRDITQIG